MSAPMLEHLTIGVNNTLFLYFFIIDTHVRVANEHVAMSRKKLIIMLVQLIKLYLNPT